MTNPIPLADHLKKYLIPAFERKAKSIIAIDVRKLTSYTDTLMIIEANSQRQVTSIAEHIIKSMKVQKVGVIGAEGIKEGEWALLDYGDVIIHVFESRIKSYYNLEGLWADAPLIDLSGFKTEPEEEYHED
ncbi:MAG: ribosome silencing factor [Desulfobacula sp.]|jgi:ribosome-associated protein